MALAPLQRGVAVLRELTALFGIFRTAPQEAGGDDALIGDLMQLLIDLRTESRKKKDFETADRIRDGLFELGVKLEDRKGETGWRLER